MWKNNPQVVHLSVAGHAGMPVVLKPIKNPQVSKNAPNLAKYML